MIYKKWGYYKKYPHFHLTNTHYSRKIRHDCFVILFHMMGSTKKLSFLVKSTLSLVLLFLVACSEPKFRLHEKLEARLQEDLQMMVAEVLHASGDKHLLEEPYFEIADLRFFTGDTARIYAAYAEVDFYYYKGIDIYQKRKYRYDAARHYWDRYYKKMLFSKNVNDSIISSNTREN